MTHPCAPRVGPLLFVLSGNMLIDALEVSVAVVAMPAIGRDLGLPLTSLHWVMTGFALGFGGALLLGARLVAAFGRRRLYLAALAVFVAASIVGALADTAAPLVLSRVVKGVCAALTAPTGLVIIAATWPAGPIRNRALSVYSFFGAAGFGVGLLLAGGLTQVSWRWSLGIVAPVGLALLVAAIRVVPADTPATPRQRLGATGAALLAGAAAAAVYGVVRVAAAGWRDGVGAAALVAAVLAALLFAVTQRRSPRPLVPPDLIRGSFARSAVGAATLNGSHWGLLLVATLDLQLARSWSSMATGLVLLPMSVLLVLATPFSGRLIARFGASRLVAVGAAVAPLGYLLYLVGAPTSAAPAALVAAMLLVGVAFAVSFAALHARAVSEVAATEQPVAGAVYQTAVQLGGALALSLVAAVLVAAGKPGPVDTESLVGAHRAALLVVVALGLVGLLAAVLPARAGAAFVPRRSPVVR